MLLEKAIKEYKFELKEANRRLVWLERYIIVCSIVIISLTLYLMFSI